MMKLIAIIRDTFRELIVRKALIGFLALNVIGLIGIAIYIGADTFSNFAQKANLPMTDEIRNQMAGIIEVGIAAFFNLLLIFVSIFTTASVLPAMLETGTIDLYLSKPISRPMLLFGKILGSISVVAANIAVFIFGAWIILSLKLGIWNTGFLAAGVMMLFSFIILYSMIVLLNVLTRSGTLGIMITYVHVLIISGILASREKIAEMAHNDALRTVLNVFYYALPQSSDHTNIAGILIMHGTIQSWTPIWCSALFAAVVYSAAGWLFSRKEF